MLVPVIGYWFEDPAKAAAGKKAFVVNRIGDFGVLLAMFLIFWTLQGVGAATLSIGGTPVAAAAGETVLMPANVPHAVQAAQRFKMLLTMIRG